MTAAAVPRETFYGKVRPLLFRKEMREANAAGVKDTTRRIVTAENTELPHGAFENLRLETGRGFRGPGAWIRAQCTFGENRVRVVTVLPRIRVGDLFWQKEGRFGARAASTATLEITSVDVARVQDMTDAEAMREGVAMLKARPGERPRETFARLWEAINGRGSWAANPWVWVYRYRVHTINVDELLRGLNL